MNIKLVADSSANLNECEKRNFSVAPLSVVVGERAFRDDAQLDVSDMLHAMKHHKGKTSTACPGVQDWLSAFGEAEAVLGVTITSALSGTYNTAAMAAREYGEAHPDRKVFILDSLSTGPEMELILEKYQECMDRGEEFETICKKTQRYADRTQLLFSLESLSNLVKNGRVSPAAAVAAGLLGIRLVGRAGKEGTLEPLCKCRGEKRAIRRLLEAMLESGYQGGKVRISHTDNEPAAHALEEEIRQRFPDSDIAIRSNTGLCSYYAERGGFLVGYET